MKFTISLFLIIEVAPEVTFDDEWNKKVILRAGSTRTYKLPYIGYPEPKITWTYNDVPHLPEAITTSADDKEIVIALKNVARTDGGVYELKVWIVRD